MQEDLLFTLGQRIRFMRVKRKLSQEELGFKSGLSTNSISAIERGAFNFRIKTLFALADALDINADELLTLQF